MNVYSQLQAAYQRTAQAQDRINDLAMATASLIAAAETELTQARAELDAIAASLGYTITPHPGADGIQQDTRVLELIPNSIRQQ